MNRHLSDLDELVQSVRSAYTKEYLCEAITAYRAGAYRAAVATTWVAVCIDIIEKIRELSSSGDPAAEKLEQELDAIDPVNKTMMQKFEGSLLDYAFKELEIISLVEKAHLERLREDRNICVHPTFQQDGRNFTISPEVTRSHIVQACTLLFIQVPTKGKAIIGKIYDRLNGLSFPEDDEKVFQILASDTYLRRAKDSVFRNLCIVLLKRVFKDEKPLPLSLGNKIFAALNAIGRLQPVLFAEIFAEKINLLLAEVNDVRLKRTFPLIDRVRQSWSVIDEAYRIQLVELVSTFSAKDIIKYRIPQTSSHIHDIKTALISHLGTFNDADKKIVLAGSPSSAFKGLAIEIFVNSGSFDSAYDNGMEYLLPHAEHFDAKDLRGILAGALENSAFYGINQVLHAGGMDEVLLGLYKASKCNISDSALIWSQFWEKLIEKGYVGFDELRVLLLTDKIIEPTPVQVDGEDEMPFCEDVT